MRPAAHHKRTRQSGAADSEPGPYCAARWRLGGSVLPPLERAVEVGAIARKAAMSRAKELFSPRDIPPALCGHGLPEDAKHMHMFYLPEDADNDGRIDHITVFQRTGFNNRTLRVLVELDLLYAYWGCWPIVENWIARWGEPLGSLIAPSRVWGSVTPFLAPRHVKRALTITDQILWQCQDIGLPAPVAWQAVQTVTIGGRQLSPKAFEWIRPGSQLRPPDTRGGFWLIAFEDAIDGPVAIGFNCHFGLGLFRPLEALA
ncbi:MAG: type I-U CRISPR-associated protein Csb2 [Defluviicoccus sp.]